MVRIEFYVGLDCDRNGQIISLQTQNSGMEAIDSVLREAYTGYTMTLGQGVYKNGDEEETAIYTVFFRNPEAPKIGELIATAEKVAKQMAAALNQESVLWFTTAGTGDFAYQE